MTAARKPSAASIERALLNLHRTMTNMGRSGSSVSLKRYLAAFDKLVDIAARLSAGSRRGK